MASRSPLDQLDSRSNRHPVPSGSITASIARQRRIGGRKKFPWTSSANGQTTSSSFRRRRTATSSTRSRHRNPHYLLPHGCQAPRAHVLNPLHRSHNTLLQHPSPRFELYGPRQRIRMSRSPSKKKSVEVAVVNVSSCDTNHCSPFDFSSSVHFLHHSWARASPSLHLVFTNPARLFNSCLYAHRPLPHPDTQLHPPHFSLSCLIPISLVHCWNSTLPYPNDRYLSLAAIP